MTDTFSVRKLSNGIKVLLHRYAGDGETVTFGISYNVGGRNEWEDRSLDGISHFLEHQFFKGSHDLTPTMVNQAIDDLGGMTNAFTTEDSTCYYTKCLKSELYHAIDLWDRLMHYGPIRQEDFDKEAFVVRQEFRRQEDDPLSLLYKQLKKRIYQGTSLEMDVIGTEESLATVTIEQMTEYRAKHYGLENAVFLVLGNFDADAVYDKLDQTFGQVLLKGSKPSYQITKYQSPISSGFQYFYNERPIPIVYFGLAFLIPGGKTIEDRGAIDLLISFLSLGRSSLIQRYLIRSGITAFAYAFDQTYEDIGSILLLAGSTPDLYLEAHQTSMKMFWELLTMDVTSEDLVDLCDRIENVVVSVNEDPIAVMDAQATGFWRYGQFTTMEQDMAELRAVSLDDFNRVRTKVLSNFNGYYGITGTVDTFPEFPEGTWEGKFTKIDN